MSTILQLAIPYKAYLWQEGPQLDLNLDNLEFFLKLNGSFNSRKFLLPTCLDTVTKRETPLEIEVTSSGTG